MGSRQPDEDARLMLSFQAGDRQAFEQLFARYTGPLVGFLTRMVRDRGRAEELAQETFVRVYKARERYEARAKFSTWLFGIAHNLALNELDRAYRGREKPLETEHQNLYADPAAGSDEEVAAHELAGRIEEALAGLPERQRSALLLRSERDMGYEEIAQVLGTSVSSVKSLLHRAREKLLVELEGVGM